MPEPLLYETSSPGRVAYSLPAAGVPESPLPDGLVRDDLCCRRCPRWT